MCVSRIDSIMVKIDWIIQKSTQLVPHSTWLSTKSTQFDLLLTNSPENRLDLLYWSSMTHSVRGKSLKHDKLYKLPFAQDTSRTNTSEEWATNICGKLYSIRLIEAQY